MFTYGSNDGHLGCCQITPESEVQTRNPHEALQDWLMETVTTRRPLRTPTVWARTLVKAKTIMVKLLTSLKGLGDYSSLMAAFRIDAALNRKASGFLGLT